MATVADLARIPEPERRAEEAQAWLERAATAKVEVLRIRDASVAELRGAGWSQRRVAALLGLTPARVAQIDAAAGLASRGVT